MSKMQNQSPPDKEDLGGFSYIPYKTNLKELARKNRKNPTQAEKKMWNEVLKNQTFKELKFHRQKPLDRYIADFYCSKLMLVIEIDGDFHLEEGAEEYDEQRTMDLECFGIKVIRFTNNDVMNNIKKVCKNLSKEIEIRRKELKI